MCRLLGWTAATPVRLPQLVGPVLDDFVALSREHRDGWGVAWRESDGTVRTFRSTRPAYADPQLAEVLGDVRATGGILHLRWATPGLPVRVENNHPFVADGLGFAHNGAIRPVSGLLALVPERERPTLTGDTDSERYFRVILDRAAGGDLVAGIRAAITDIDAALTPSSLNALLLGEDLLVAVSVHDVDSAPTLGSPRAAAERASADETDPAKQGPPETEAGYFDLSYRIDGDALVVASSGWPQRGWTVVPNGSALIVGAVPAEVAVREVGTLARSAARRAAAAPLAADPAGTAQAS
jgi:predicted glutamine amidotransferase